MPGVEKDGNEPVEPEADPAEELDRLKNLIRRSNLPEARHRYLEEIQARFGNRAALDVAEELKLEEEPEEEEPQAKEQEPSGVKPEEEE
jgi:hypothetical protein